MEEKALLKDQVLNPQKVSEMAENIKKVYPAFDKGGYVDKVTKKLPSLELSQRIKWISEVLREYLPQDYKQAVLILLKSLPPHNDSIHDKSDFGDFIYAPYSDFIAKYGCDKKNLSFSLSALKEITKRYSAEDAIRYFINSFPIETIQTLITWAKDLDYHVRRLASEGTRPMLPWSQRIKIQLIESKPILDSLYTDNNKFVIKSVANHINDISKRDPSLAINMLKKWRDSKRQNAKTMEFLTNQGLRTLIKSGNKDAIAFLNLSSDPKITVSNFSIASSQLKIGDCIEFSLTLKAEKDEALLIDYVIYFKNKAGNGYNKKVFKLKKLNMVSNQILTINKKHLLKNMSTRKLYPGQHKLDIQINGKNVGEKIFNLT